MFKKDKLAKVYAEANKTPKTKVNGDQYQLDVSSRNRAEAQKLGLKSKLEIGLSLMPSFRSLV